MKHHTLKIFTQMARIRMVEQYIAKRYPEEQMKCPTHLCVGQEAVPAVFGVLTEPRDVFMGTYRSHGHYLAKGGDLVALFAELLGKPSGCSKGFGGSMHVIDTRRHFMGTSAIVASGIPIAAGAALSLKYRKLPSIVAVFFGDAALEKGSAYETANFASLHKLPLLMVCENNGLAVTTPLKARQASLALYNRFTAMGIRGQRIKENDVQGLITVARDEVKNVRNGHGPVLIEYQTLRYAAHVGHAIDGPVDLWWQNPFASQANACALALFVRKLLKEKQITTKRIQILRQRIQKDIEYSYEKALSSPSFHKTDVSSYVYASGLSSRLNLHDAKHTPQALTSKTASKLVNPF